MEIIRHECMGRMSRAVAHGGVLFLSGHTAPTDRTTYREQTEYITERLSQVLEQYGSDKQHILAATIYLKDMGGLDEMNAVWDLWIGDHGPARTCVAAAMANDAMLVEITVTAALK